MSAFTWSNKKKVFGSGQSRITFGEKITEEIVGKERFKTFLKDGDISETKVEIKVEEKKPIKKDKKNESTKR